MRVANAPCSWGVLEFESTPKVCGYDQVLDEIAASGYAGTELGDWEFMPTDPAALRAEIDKRRLSLVGAFVPVALALAREHAPGLERALRTARLISSASDGQAFLVLADANGTVEARIRNAGRVTPDLSLNDGEWRVFAQGAERIAWAVLDETGVRTVFHHHCAGYVETPAEVDALLSHTDPRLLGLCLDTGHYTFAGGNPVAALRKYRHRVRHVHFKDCSANVAAAVRQAGLGYFEAVRRGVFCELGHGSVDFPGVVAELRNLAWDGWIVVEQDVLPSMGTPFESAQRNREYLRSIGLEPAAAQAVRTTEVGR